MGGFMIEEVECYAGSHYPEKPRVFTWEGQRYEVRTILDQHREPDCLVFLVRCSPDESLFKLYYSFSEDQWRIQSEGSANIIRPQKYSELSRRLNDK